LGYSELSLLEDLQVLMILAVQRVSKSVSWMLTIEYLSSFQFSQNLNFLIDSRVEAICLLTFVLTTLSLSLGLVVLSSSSPLLVATPERSAQQKHGNGFAKKFLGTLDLRRLFPNPEAVLVHLCEQKRKGS
jgi:hypothetical protein